MPLYEYYCTDCQTKFEAIRPMSKADAAIQCKRCESIHTSRVLSLFATHMKGEKSASLAMTGDSGLGGGCCGGGACGCHH